MEAALRRRTHRMLMLDGGLRPAPSRSPEVEQQLIATARSWPREIQRHEATKRRLERLLHDLA